MTKIETLKARRQKILEELVGLEEMRRGSVVEQFFETVRKDGSKGRRGPYALYSFKEKGKTVSRRLSGEEQIRKHREQIQTFRRFQELMGELVALGEQMADSQSPSDAVMQPGVEKKPLR